MASEYLKKKYADVKPDEPLVLTKKQKRQNWWDYHKFHLLAAVLIAGLLGFFIHDMVTKTLPDYQIAFVADGYLFEEQQNQIIDEITKLATDVNEDGEVVIYFNQYVLDDVNPNNYVDVVKLTADITAGDSTIFLLDDPVGFQKQYGVLMQRNGMLLEDADDPSDCLYYALEDCPALQGIDLKGKFYLSRRFADEKTEEDVSLLWEALTAGAVSPEGVEQ